MNSSTKILSRAENILNSLVSFPSLSRTDNTGIIQWIEEYLQGYDLKTRRIPTNEGSYNLFATLGPSRDGGICLSGHLDVVPVQKEHWTKPPFQLGIEEKCEEARGTEKNGSTGFAEARLYGRGTTDMKGFVSLVLAMVPEWIAENNSKTDRPVSRFPIHLAFTYDEETGCSGIRPLIEELGKSLPRPEVVIVGEPTSLIPVTGHRAGTSCVTEVTGRPAHSSNPEAGINSIYIASDLIQRLRGIYREFKKNPRKNTPFSPPYSTISVGVMEGGTARNIVPDRSVFLWEVRSLPEDNPDEVLQQLAEYAETQVLPPLRQDGREPTVRTTVETYYPALEPREGKKALDFVRSLGCDKEAGVVNFGTEAGLYQEAGIPAVVWGPGGIAQAHTNDEYILRSQLSGFLEYLMRI